LLWSLHRRIESVDEAAILRSLARASVAAVAAGLLMLGGLAVAEATIGGLLDNGFGRLLVLLVLTAAGAAIFVLVAAALRSPELQQLRGILRRRRSA
jgi:hypothetical protein